MLETLGKQVIGSGHYPRQPISDYLEYEFAIQLTGGLDLLHKAITGADALGSTEQYPFTPPRRPLGIFDLIPRTPTTSNLIHYVEQTSITQAAAPVAQNGLKPELSVTYAQRSTTPQVIATWIPVTNRMLADATVLEAILDTTLVQALNVQLEAQILTGNGTDPNLLGILNTTGISSYIRTGGEPIFNAVRKAATVTILTGEVMPNGVIMHPTDLEQMELTGGGTTGTGGSTFGGGTFGGPSPTLLGAFSLLTKLTIIQTPAMPQGTALVGAFDVGCMLFDR